MKHYQPASASRLLMLLGCGLSLVCTHAQAGGVALGATRLVYQQGESQIALPVRNSDEAQAFLIQSWVNDEKGKKSADFVVTPPLFTLQPKSENTLRVIFTGANLPSDRERVYYFNSKAIPAVSKKEVMGKNTLQIAVQSEIKLFLRPKDLPTAPIDAPATLRCNINGDQLVVTNPSPYFVTLTNPTVGGKKIESGMVPPKSALTLPLKGVRGQVMLQTVNDYGAFTAAKVCPAS